MSSKPRFAPVLTSRIPCCFWPTAWFSQCLWFCHWTLESGFVSNLSTSQGASIWKPLWRLSTSNKLPVLDMYASNQNISQSIESGYLTGQHELIFNIVWQSFSIRIVIEAFYESNVYTLFRLRMLKYSVHQNEACAGSINSNFKWSKGLYRFSSPMRLLKHKDKQWTNQVIGWKNMKT